MIYKRPSTFFVLAAFWNGHGYAVCKKTRVRKLIVIESADAVGKSEKYKIVADIVPQIFIVCVDQRIRIQHDAVFGITGAFRAARVIAE